MKGKLERTILIGARSHDLWVAYGLVFADFLLLCIPEILNQV